MKNKGFTLIEVLVALAILAVALIAIVKATGVSTRQATQVKQRLLAHWVLRDIWKQVELELIVCPQEKEYRLFNETFLWKCEQEETNNSQIVKFNISIHQENQMLDKLSYYTMVKIKAGNK